MHPAYAIPLLQVGLVDGTGASFGASGADHKFSRPFGPGSSVNDIGLATYVDKGTELYVVQSGVDASFSAEFGSLRGAVGTIGQMAFDPLDRPVIYATAVGNGSASWSDTWRITGAAGPITNLNIKGHFDGSLNVDAVIGGGTPYCLTPDMGGQYRLLVGGSLIYTTSFRGTHQM